MFTAGLFGGLAMFFVGIAILVLITSLIRLLGPILMIAGIYYFIKTIRNRNAQAQEAGSQEQAKEEPVIIDVDPEWTKDEAEKLAEKYEDPQFYNKTLNK